jgi:hypothetical protein
MHEAYYYVRPATVIRPVATLGLPLLLRPMLLSGLLQLLALLTH